MKNIFLDCGTHLCEGLIQFYNDGIINDSFTIYTFEANPACNVPERIKQIPLNITAFTSAVWVEDGTVTFNQENHQKTQTNSPTDGYSDIDGWGSSVDEVGSTHPGYETKVEVPSIDFSKFVSELPEDSNIICKMDIEGAEYKVLRKMIQDKTISKIKEIYIEFHSYWVKTESRETETEIVKQIENLGVKVHPWY
jgi:FkbM family methyltransferase